MSRQSASILPSVKRQGSLKYHMQQQQQQQQHSDWYWAVVGYLCILLGGTHMVLSALYFYWFGIAVGFSLGKIGFTSLGMAYVSQKSESLPWILKVVSLWGSSVVRKLFTVFRWPMFVFGLYISLCIFIRVESRDSFVKDALATFPKSCDASAPSPLRGCSRVKVYLEEYSDDTPHKDTGSDVHNSTSITSRHGIVHRLMKLGQGSQHDAPIHIETDTCTSVDEVASKLEQWTLQSHTFSRVMTRQSKKETIYMHFRILSTVFGFADDFMIQVAAEKKDKAPQTLTVTAQGQLRLGVSDLGVNTKRNTNLVLFIQELCARKTSR
jgi:uncharacterized protein (DUF1499 family)